MTDNPRGWVFRHAFSGVIDRLKPHFEVSAEEGKRKFIPCELAARLARRDAGVVGRKHRTEATELGAAGRPSHISTRTCRERYDLPYLIEQAIP